MDTMVVAQRLVGFGSPLCSGWAEMPETARAAVADFVGWLSCEPVLEGLDLERVCDEFAQAACPIYYDDSLALLMDERSRRWLEDLSDGYEVDCDFTDVTLFQFASREVNGMLAHAVYGVLSQVAGDLVDGCDDDGEFGCGWRAFDLSPEEAEVARSLFADGWSGSLSELLEAARRLEVSL